MRLARWIFLLAGVYGLLMIPPMYFLERTIAGSRQPLTHPEFYYGFLGVVLAWQLAFLVVARNPRRYRGIMLAALVEKFSYVIAVAVLYSAHRVSAYSLVPAAVDLVLGVLFIVAYLETSRAERQPAMLPTSQGTTESAGPLI